MLRDITRLGLGWSMLRDITRFGFWSMLRDITRFGFWSMLRDITRLGNDNHSQFEAVKKPEVIRAWGLGLRDYRCIGLRLQVT